MEAQRVSVENQRRLAILLAISLDEVDEEEEKMVVKG